MIKTLSIGTLLLLLTVTCKSQSLPDNINISSNSSTSVDEVQMNNVLVYPNPADKQIVINNEGLKQIYNILGEIVLQTYDKKIDVTNLSKGVYVIKLEDVNIRLIKQ